MKKRPNFTAVLATSLTTGEVVEFKTMTAASVEGGFDYQAVQNCVRGLAKSHAGYRFEAASPLRPVTQVRPRVHEVASLINKNQSIKEIAQRLGLQRGTVTLYRRQAASLGLLVGEAA